MQMLELKTMHQKLIDGVTFWYLRALGYVCWFLFLTVIELEKVACLILIFFFPLMNFSHCNFTERFTSAGKKKKCQESLVLNFYIIPNVL